MAEGSAESLHFYEYLCQKLGSKKEVKGRRLFFTAVDTSCDSNGQISSGSKSEGLDLKGSDFDLMHIDQHFIVYQSEKEAVEGLKAALIMDSEYTQPCFIRLRLYTNYNMLGETCRNMLEEHGLEKFISNELFKNYHLQWSTFGDKSALKMHGPCISDINDIYDFAYCLKCDQWISQAVPWINRPRSSWLSPEIISKIIMFGVLFVPIGLKGSIYEHLEWRISFSVAEKFLIFSFNHTQLLCYALLKILLKEIVNSDENVKSIMCSYFLKTLMFWMSDDSDPSIWRPDNIIPCFMACLQRLLYCVKYSTLLHYFVPDYNLFNVSLSTEIDKKKKMTNLLTNLYRKEIQLFSASETLHDYTGFHSKISKQCDINTGLVKDVFEISFCMLCSFYGKNVRILLNRMLYHSKTELFRDIFLYFISKAYQYVPQLSNFQYKISNKHQYNKYKHDISNLSKGLHSDAVNGWMMLASFFYFHENYPTALFIVNYALSKFTDEKCSYLYTSTGRFELTLEQRYVFHMMKKEKLITTLKALTIDFPRFVPHSQIIPKELKYEVLKHRVSFHPLTFAHFLRFLCYYHLNDLDSCVSAILQLVRSVKKIHHNKQINIYCLRSFICVGIADQMIGLTTLSDWIFSYVAQHDTTNYTCAETRLRGLRMDH